MWVRPVFRLAAGRQIVVVINVTKMERGEQRTVPGRVCGCLRQLLGLWAKLRNSLGHVWLSVWPLQGSRQIT